MLLRLLAITYLLIMLSAPSFASSYDCNIRWDEVYHTTFSPFYRSIPGAVPYGTNITLRIRTAEGDLTGVKVRIWNAVLRQQFYLDMQKDTTNDSSSTYDWWVVALNTGNMPTVLFYFFELTDSGSGNCQPKTNYYVASDPDFYGGNFGQVVPQYTDQKSFQITVYDPNFKSPSWMQRGITYQIFPDKFRDGNPKNNQNTPQFYYGYSTIFRSNQDTWNSTVCDPRWTYSPNCPYKYGENFYGGDLQGIIEKIKAGFFNNLGVTTIYLNPIFKAPSNHKYDTANFMEIDPGFGTLEDFKALTATAHAHNIRIILDGVFNHTSSDSAYFDRFARYSNDGACEATTSPFRNWFYMPAIGNPAKENGVPVACAGGQTYEIWGMYESLPKLNSSNPDVRKYIWNNGIKSVAPYWIAMGADGWRLDVGGDIDPGFARDPSNDYWEGFRAAVRNAPVTGKNDTIIIGEEWGDATPWLLGNEWDSVMNYRFRSAVLGWLFTGCSGEGCSHNGAMFEDNDSAIGSSSGPIHYLSPTLFNARLLTLWEKYPPMAYKSMMNLAGSHDTNRVRFLLKKSNFNNDEAALQRMMEWWIFSFTYPGSPTLLYGEEIGLSHDAVYFYGKWEDDPYTRIPYPWDDTPGNYSANLRLMEFERKMASIRHSYRALQDGEIQHGLIVNDQDQTYGFGRLWANQFAFIGLNRSNTKKTASFERLDQPPYNLPEGTMFVDSLSGKQYKVSMGRLTVEITPNWGVVLIDPSKVDKPMEVANLTFRATENNVDVRFTPVYWDTNKEPELVTTYQLYRINNDRKGEGYTLVSTFNPPSFGTPDGTIIIRDQNVPRGSFTYAIRAFNGIGNYSVTNAAISLK